MWPLGKITAHPWCNITKTSMLVWATVLWWDMRVLQVGHISIFFYTSSTCHVSRCHGELGPIPAVIVREAGFTLDRQLIHCRGHSHLQ